VSNEIIMNDGLGGLWEKTVLAYCLHLPDGPSVRRASP